VPEGEGCYRENHIVNEEDFVVRPSRLPQRLKHHIPQLCQITNPSGKPPTIRPNPIIPRPFFPQKSGQQPPLPLKRNPIPKTLLKPKIKRHPPRREIPAQTLEEMPRIGAQLASIEATNTRGGGRPETEAS
jgi:hypothetical protein